MLVLLIDTSSCAVTAAVGEVGDGNAAGGVALRAARTTLAPRGHSELLTPSIDGVLHEAGATTRDLAAIVAGTGPGPFTGLRVGLVTAGVLGSVAGIPTYGVCSLDAIGDAARGEPELLVVTDARRHEVYWARYASGARTGTVQVARPAEVSTDGLTAVAGAGLDLYADAWPGLAHRPERYPDPVALARLARDRVIARAPSEALEPRYLRRPDAVPPAPR